MGKENSRLCFNCKHGVGNYCGVHKHPINRVDYFKNWCYHWSDIDNCDSNLRNDTCEEKLIPIETCKLNKDTELQLEKVEKYRWHDLRKNPNDLPKESGEYDVTLEFEEGRICIRAWFKSQINIFLNALHITDEDKIGWSLLNEWYDLTAACREYIIAWKEIEVFEGEEK